VEAAALQLTLRVGAAVAAAAAGFISPPQEMLNPGQRQWLQLLCDRDAIAHQQRQLEGDIPTAEALAAAAAAADPDGSATTSDLKPVVDIQQLQQAAAGGGQLERLQLTPMQLADMVQECAYTMDPIEAQMTAQLLAAADITVSNSSTAAGFAATSGSSSDSGSGGSMGGSSKACCGLWPELAVMGRSCAPNVTLGLAGDGLLVVRAAEYLPAGTQVGVQNYHFYSMCSGSIAFVATVAIVHDALLVVRGIWVAAARRAVGFGQSLQLWAGLVRRM
jgi:hypothetical protein